MSNVFKGKSKSDEFFFVRFGPHSVSTPGTYINHVDFIAFSLIRKKKQTRIRCEDASFPLLQLGQAAL